MILPTRIAGLLSRFILPTTSQTAPAVSYFPVFNPAAKFEDESAIIAQVRNMGPQDAKIMISSAHEAHDYWKRTTGQHRSDLLFKWSRSIRDNADDIATLMTLESGKPLHESRGEINYGCSYIEFYAAEAVRSTSAGGGSIIPSPFTDTEGRSRGKVLALKEGIGLCSIITPWNFPFAMFARKVAPALAAGCTCVLKPSELTPLTALAIRELAVEEDVGVPSQVFQVITADRNNTESIGEELSTNYLVRKLSFTGSTVVGKKLFQQASGTVKKLSLELGGNAPFIVFDDADIGQAIDAAFASKFRNAGQTCVCADRFLVHESLVDSFVTGMVEKVNEINIGSGLKRSSNFGPLISPQAAERVEKKVNDAIEEGAKLVVGGRRLLESHGTNFYEPTILKNVPTSSRIWSEETFGPVVSIKSFRDEEECLNLANDSAFGLAGYFCTQNFDRVFRVSSELQAGIIGVNEGVMATAYAPFGGVKESGLGREGSPVGIEEYLETKYIFLNH